MTAVDVDTAAALDVVIAAYAAERAGVDTAYRRMLATTSGRHAPADVRRAAANLTVALRGATTTASEALRLIALAPPHRTRRQQRRHRRDSRSVPAATPNYWSAELVRLTQIAVWARRATLDDLGVHVPAVVRVSTLAAAGPHIAGMDAEPAERVRAATDEPRIGVDLAVVVDRVEPRSARSRAASAAEATAPRAVWAR